MSLTLGASCIFGVTAAPATDLTAKVDPRIGTGGHGHVFYGANVPFGLVQLGPSQRVKGWDWCSGYHESDTTLLGFSHTHLSGTGIGDLGDILMMPNTTREFGETTFSHSDETCTPGYYRLRLPQQAVTAELTATTHTGMHRYTPHNPADSVYVLIDTQYGIGWDAHTSSNIRRTGDATLSGYRNSKGWAPDQRIYFTTQFSRPIASYTYDEAGRAVCAFAPSESPLIAKVGISAVSESGAAANLSAENPYWDFDAVKQSAVNDWNRNLARIDITTSDPRIERIFYTSMYHSMFAPMTFSDVTGQYRGADGKIYTSPEYPVYTLFSLWDTYRAAHPLYSLIIPEMQPALTETFINIYRQQGKLPVWHLHGNETDCMIGNPGAIVLADLTLKGFAKDPEQAYEALRASSLLTERSMGAMQQYGYVPYDAPDCEESVARGMEYAIAYDAVAKVAAKLGKTEDAARFATLGKAYTHYFDPALGFMRGKSMDGKFRDEDYNPFKAAHRADDYCEGNGWQYIWLVPHDPQGLIKLFGGKRPFMAKLDQLFTATGDLGDEASPDISGLIGQYAHGNEPSHHVLYLYNYAGAPHKAAPLLRKVMNEMYRDLPDGLCGNEDVGQMSSWYILSSIGLYQVEPASGKYVIGTPIVDKATLNVGQGRTFTVSTVNNSPQNIYVQKATLNGKPLKRNYVDFSEIAQGGNLVLHMGNSIRN